MEHPPGLFLIGTEPSTVAYGVHAISMLQLRSAQPKDVRLAPLGLLRLTFTTIRLQMNSAIIGGSS